MKQFSAAMFALLLLIGCAPSDEPTEKVTTSAPPQNLEATAAEPETADMSQFVGMWYGRYETSTAAPSNELVQSFLLYRATLELRANGSYRFVSREGANPIEDIWKTNGEMIVLASSGAVTSRLDFTEMGTPNGQEYDLKVADDGTLIGPNPLPQYSGAMVFRKQ